MQSPDPEARTDDWCAVVEIYSKCQLTKGDDKLVALSGIVSGMQENQMGLAMNTLLGFGRAICRWACSG
jgi:hypothetical protein